MAMKKRFEDLTIDELWQLREENGLGVHIENVILSLVGFWMLFMLIEIMWVRYKSQIREMLNEKNK